MALIRGASYDQELNTTDDVTFDNVSINAQLNANTGDFAESINVGDGGTSGSEGVTISTTGGTHEFSVTGNIAYLQSYNRILIRNSTTEVFDSKGGEGIIASSVPAFDRGCAFKALSAAYEAVVVVGASSQTEDLVKWTDSSSTLLGAIRASGGIALFNNWVDGSNFESAYANWDANVFEIGTEKEGSGTARSIDIAATGARNVRFSGSGLSKFYGHVRFNGSTFDIGESTSLSAPRHIYAANSVQAATLLKSEGTIESDGGLGLYGVTPPSQAAHFADAETSHDLTMIFSDTEVEAALDNLGTKLNSLIAIMENVGLMATT